MLCGQNITWQFLTDTISFTALFVNVFLFLFLLPLSPPISPSPSSHSRLPPAPSHPLSPVLPLCRSSSSLKRYCMGDSLHVARHGSACCMLQVGLWTCLPIFALVCAGYSFFLLCTSRVEWRFGTLRSQFYSGGGELFWKGYLLVNRILRLWQKCRTLPLNLKYKTIHMPLLGAGISKINKYNNNNAAAKDTKCKSPYFCFSYRKSYCRF